MEKAKLLGQKSIDECQGLGLGGGDRGTREFGGVMKIFCILTVVVITVGCIYQNSSPIYPKGVNFTVYRLYFNKSYFKR